MLLKDSTRRQTRALIRRYFANLCQSPPQTIFRNLLWPLLVIGASIWIVFSHGPDDVRNFAIESPTYYAYRLTLFPVFHFTEWLVNDKTTGVKFLLTSMGLKRSSFYLANTFCFMLFIAPYLLGSVLLCFVYAEYKICMIAIPILLTMFLAQITGLVFLLSTILSSPTKAFVAPALVLLDMHLFRRFVTQIMEHTDKSLWPTVHFITGVSPFESMKTFIDSYAVITEANHDLANITQRVLNPNEIVVSQSFFLIIVSMAFWTTVCFICVYCFDQFEPTQETSGKNQLCFTWSKLASLLTFMLNKARANKSTSQQQPGIPNVLEIETGPESFQELQGTKHFERRALNDLHVGIRLQGLTKIYNSIPAVNEVNFDIYKGETTLLLGHNGAGKTTMMNMILGKLKPDRGEVIIMDEFGGSFGVCPQESILDERLSVKQHLQLIADVKLCKMTGLKLEEDIRRTINEVGLEEQIDLRPPELSGGMKRKLSLAMAAVGGSRILILDEPSSGIDPESRTSIWEVVRGYRADRIILLSTQHMEEAEFLGDRVAIMSSGRIICCGSSKFLNESFGTGYKLTVECKPGDASGIMSLAREHFSGAKLSENDQQVDRVANNWANSMMLNLVIELIDASKTAKELEDSLIKMFEVIEKESHNLGIKSYGLKSSSIEDVILNTNKTSCFGESDKQQQQHQLLIDVAYSLKDQISNLAQLSQQTSICCDSVIGRHRPHFNAFVLKQLHYYKREWLSIIFFRVILLYLGMKSLVEDLNYYTKLHTTPDIFMTPIIHKTPDIHAIPDIQFKKPYESSLGNILLICHLIYYPTLERVQKFKTIQLASHANIFVYWLAQLAIDMITILGLVLLINIILMTTFDGDNEVPMIGIHFLLTLSIILFGISATLLAYILSTILGNEKTCIGYHVVWYGMPYVVSMIIKTFILVLQQDLPRVTKFFDRFFTILLPSDCIEYIVYGFTSKCYVKQKNSECEANDDFSPVGFGFLCLCGQILVYSAILCMIEWNNFNPSNWRNSANGLIALFKKLESTRDEIDPDVLEESVKAKRMLDIPKLHVVYKNCCLVIANLSKSYSATVQVIKSLSITVNQGECFGLLGPNGAGKSTVFSMVSAEVKPDSGNILLNDCDSVAQTAQYRQQLGFDPQTDPAIPLSPSEALYLMARLRNVDEMAIPMLVSTILDLLQMAQHGKKCIKELSGGTKRKLALGMSLIGRPELLALDEPTSGIDPMARRYIWQLLRALKSELGIAIVIASNSMEECEAICDRISIMKDGKLRCIGSFAHLRSKFSQSFIVKFSLDYDQQARRDTRLQEDLARRLELIFGSNSIKILDTQQYRLTVDILAKTTNHSSVLKSLKQFKEIYSNLSYVLNDSSLEHIFISLAREQHL